MDGFLLRPMAVYRQVLLTQFQVNAFGDVLAGAGIFAAGPYYCGNGNVLVLATQCGTDLTGLDVGSRRELFAELLAFMKREDRTILISSHQLTDLERFADHYIIIDKGRLIAQGPMDALVDRYHQLDARPPQSASRRLVPCQHGAARL